MQTLNKISKLSSDTICALRFPLMVGIVFIHFSVINGITVQGVEYGSNPPYWLVCVNIMCSHVLPSVCVPLFFLISGYLFFLSGFSVDSYKRKIRTRVKTLLVPYILWNALALLYLTIRTLPCFSSIFPHGIEPDWNIQNILASFWDKTDHGVFFNPNNTDTTREHIAVPQDGPLWYVRNLMIAVLFSPLFYYFIKVFKHWGLLLIGLGWFVAASCDFMTPSQLFTTSFFFSWGAYYAINREDFVSSIRRFRIAPYLYIPIALLDMVTKEWTYNGYIHNVGIVLGIFTFVLIIANGGGSQNKFLSESSFFLFALHMIFMNDLAKIVVKIWVVDSPIYMLALYFAIPCITIAICLGLYWLLRKYAPCILSILNGGR